MVTARGGDDAGLWWVAGEKIGERAARLERPGVLQVFELQRQRERRQSEVGAGDGDDRCASDVWCDDRMNAFDLGACDSGNHDGRFYATEGVSPSNSGASLCRLDCARRGTQAYSGA